MRGNNRQSGFTLTESIIAIAILSIIAIMAFPILARMGIINIHSSDRLDAQTIGVLVTEELINTARLSDNQDSFITRIIDKDESVLTYGSFIEREGSNANEFYLINGSITISIFFDEIRPILTVRVTYNAQAFETIAWLDYET